MAAPSIRLATMADVEALAVLHVRAWQSAYRGLLPDDLLDGISLEEWTKRRRRGMEQPASPHSGRPRTKNAKDATWAGRSTRTA